MNEDLVQIRLERLANLRRKIQEANELNRKEINKLPSSALLSAKEERLRNEALELMQNGSDFERFKNLQYTAEEHEIWLEKQERKEKRKNRGFSTWNEANLRKHMKLTDEIKVTANAMENSQFKRDADSLEYGNLVDNRPSSDALERMAADIKRQQEIRARHSTAKGVDSEDHISYINEGNRRFNMKLDKAYNKYTQDIKESLERGTAL